ncbi:MAG: diacylglycerol kinase family lipid kinase [Oscillospiraceae bacterium]|nr:diacylglycerol kinase family lipid kinase [Oscillospiraceae bacterium]
MANKLKPLMMLVNPSAGRSLAEQMLGTAVGAFCAAGYVPTVYFTTGPGSASDLTAHFAPDYERMVCLGGDGTLSDVVAGLMRLSPEERPRIGYIPMGTANDVASTLDLPMRQPQRAVERILRGKPLDYDVGEMDGVGYFTYIAAFGAFTEVSYKTDQELKKALGHLAYVLEAVSSLPSLKSYHAQVEYDDGSIEGRFIYGAVSNAISVGGVMKMDPSMVDLSDGKVEILLVHEPHGPAEINSIVSGVLSRDYSSSPCLTLLHSENVSFTFDEPVPWTRDGEDGGEHVTLDLRCRAHAVRIFC